MIVRDQPSPLHLFFVMQGSIIPRIIWNILGISILTACVLLFDIFVAAVPHTSIAAMGIFGIALSLFLGFRNNAAYDRWWEARKLWGQIIADTRNFARDLSIFVGKGEDRSQLICLAVAFAHLHRGTLRGADVRDTVSGWTDPETLEHLVSQRNPADASLRLIADRIGMLANTGAINGFGQMTLSRTLSSLAASQAGCERVLTTPLPFVYSLLIRRTTYLYCWLLPFALIEAAGGFAPVFAAVVAYVFFGLQAATNELEAPFRNAQNGLPLDTMCRVIEISAAEALDRPAPRALEPENYVLT